MSLKFNVSLSDDKEMREAIFQMVREAFKSIGREEAIKIITDVIEKKMEKIMQEAGLEKRFQQAIKLTVERELDHNRYIDSTFIKNTTREYIFSLVQKQLGKMLNIEFQKEKS
jgi:flagellar motor switch protein FliG